MFSDKQINELAEMYTDSRKPYDDRFKVGDKVIVDGEYSGFWQGVTGTIVEINRNGKFIDNDCIWIYIKPSSDKFPNGKSIPKESQSSAGFLPSNLKLIQ